MIVAEDFGEITQIKMGRDLDGQVLYWVAAYLVDDLLIDTGCHHTANRELTLYTSIGKIVPKGKEAIKACLDHLESIAVEAGRLHFEENLTEEQIVVRLFGGESAMAELTGGQFAGKNLIKSLL